MVTLSLIGWDMFNFFSATAERNVTKLDSKQDLNVLYQVCVFWTDRKSKMAALVFDWLINFWLLLCYRRTKFNDTWQKSNSNVLYQVRVIRADRKNKMAALPLIGWTECSRNLTESKISTSSATFVFLGAIEDQRWPSLTLIDWDIFNVFSATAEWNATKRDWKQDLNALHQVCVFRADLRSKMAVLASYWLRDLTGWDIWQEASFNDGSLGFWFSEAFSTSSLQPLNISTKLDRKQNLNVFYQVCICRDDQKSKMAALPLMGWYIFNFVSETAERNAHETWQKAGSQRSLPRLCFWGRSKIKDGHPWLWLTETFLTSSVQPLNGMQRNWTGCKI